VVVMLLFADFRRFLKLAYLFFSFNAPFSSYRNVVSTSPNVWPVRSAGKASVQCRHPNDELVHTGTYVEQFPSGCVVS